MSTVKKYGGRIDNWYKYEPEADKHELDAIYGPNLGYCILGDLGNDPTDREFGHRPIRTSLVVKHDDRTIETLNTRYDLGDKRIER
jgi:hypothetical protein